jgi:hypothetical protein
MDIGLDWGIQSQSVGEWLRRGGFQRKGGLFGVLHGWTAGPCLDCLVPYPVEMLDTDRLCAICAGYNEPEAPPPTPLPAPTRIAVDLVAERAEHRKRMRERAQGKRPHLPDDTVFRTRSGHPLGGKVLPEY